MASFDLNTLYRLAFGYRGAPYPDFETQETWQPTDGLVHTNALGASLFMPLALDGWQLPNEPILEATLKKTIVSTALTGNTRKGTVKELINTEDYELKIKGVIINLESSTEYPSADVEHLKELVEINKSITIQSAITDILAIKKVVIQSFKLLPMVGVQHAQAYEISMLSDEDFILIQEAK
jgi:hypothetical protein